MEPMEPSVPHYYGDIVRRLFVLAAAVMSFSAPFYTSNLRVALPFVVLGAIVLLAIAALMNPHKKIIIIAGAVAAGVGMLIYETWALFDYKTSTWEEFILRQILAFVFMSAFYFSMKTLRAFVLGTIGKHEEAGEFDNR